MADAVTADLLAAVESVPGLVPARPAPGAGLPRPTMWNAATLAIDVADDVIEIRLVATALPLPDRLGQAEATCRRVLAGTRWAAVPLRLVVVDIDAAAVGA